LGRPEDQEVERCHAARAERGHLGEGVELAGARPRAGGDRVACVDRDLVAVEPPRLVEAALAHARDG
jgi:hypothetical protein